MKNKLLKITLLYLIFFLFDSCAVVGWVQSKKEIKGDYILELRPENSYGYYDMSINVIQGIAAFEKGFFTAQTSNNKYLSINYLDQNGESVYNYRFNVVSHGQDLSLEQISDTILYLYTTYGYFDKKGKSGVMQIKVTLPKPVDGKRDMSQLEMKIDKKILLGLDNATPTINEEKTKFAIRSGNQILIAKKEDVLNQNLKNVKNFDLDNTQLYDNDGNSLWFQGIAMKNEKIYCVTGNNSVDSPKYLYVYNAEGKVLEKHELNQNEFAKNVGHKYEPEGITFIDDQLYYTVMVKGETGGNRKFLFKLN